MIEGDSLWDATSNRREALLLAGRRLRATLTGLSAVAASDGDGQNYHNMYETHASAQSAGLPSDSTPTSFHDASTSKSKFISLCLLSFWYSGTSYTDGASSVYYLDEPPSEHLQLMSSPRSPEERRVSIPRLPIRGFYTAEASRSATTTTQTRPSPVGREANDVSSSNTPCATGDPPSSSRYVVGNDAVGTSLISAELTNILDQRLGDLERSIAGQFRGLAERIEQRFATTEGTVTRVSEHTQDDIHIMSNHYPARGSDARLRPKVYRIVDIWRPQHVTPST